MSIKAVIFDCDGVLVDSETISNKVLIEMAAEEGLNLDLNYALTNWQGKDLKLVFEDLNRLKGSSIKASFEEDFRERTFSTFRNDIKPIPGALNLLQKLKLPIAVASNGPRSKMAVTLSVTGLASFFKDKIYSAYDIQKWKPEPDLFLHVASRLQVLPENCLVIEDSISGVEAALKGGFQTYALAHDHNRLALQKSNATVISHLEELESVLDL